MKTPPSIPCFGLTAGKFYVLAFCLLAACFCQAQSQGAITTVFYINVPPEYDQCDVGNTRLLVEGLDPNNSAYWQSYVYTPGQAPTLVMQGIGEFRITLTGLDCPVANAYQADTRGAATQGEDMNPRPSARLRCYGGRFNVTLR